MSFIYIQFIVFKFIQYFFSLIWCKINVLSIFRLVDFLRFLSHREVNSNLTLGLVACVYMCILKDIVKARNVKLCKTLFKKIKTLYVRTRQCRDKKNDSPELPISNRIIKKIYTYCLMDKVMTKVDPVVYHSTTMLYFVSRLLEVKISSLKLSRKVTYVIW